MPPRRSRPPRAALVALCAALLPAPALAQQGAPAADSARAASLRADSVRADSVRRQRAALATVRVTDRTPRRGYAVARTATATRTDAPLRDVPQAIAVIPRALVADQAMQSMADVVRYVPGVTMAQGEGHRDAPVIRGQATTADFFVDGVRDDAQYLRDLYDAERIEALKGSSALTFGRGGGGGVINRVSKQATWTPQRTLVLEGGSFAHRRATLDVGDGAGRVAGRLNAMVERSGGFRDAFTLSRWGVHPTGTWLATSRTTVRADVEAFADARRTDRGLPSWRGAPLATAPITTFFGQADSSHAEVRLVGGTARVEHRLNERAVLRSATRAVRYDKAYANVFPGAVNAAATTVALSAYRASHDRTNLFQQGDLVASFATGGVGHVLLAGGELGRQVTDNHRATGWFGDAATQATLAVPIAAPSYAGAVTWRQNATDADNRVVATTASAYVQDQLALGRHVQAIAGVRVERFALDFANRRTGDALARTDRVVSPRVGVIVKPVEALSLYASRATSFLPSSGDQFAALTATTATLAPERFANREVGLKWDATSRLALTAAAYRLDRTNTTAPDPADPTRLVQTGAQRTTGWEAGVAGDVAAWWQVMGGVSSQLARITATTAAAPAGRTVPLVPRTAWSLWNRVQPHRTLGVGLGVIRQSAMFAAIDNTVTLPGFTRLDAALFVSLPRAARLQVNVENLLDTRYWATSHGNNNIMPGAVRTIRVAVATGAR